ncbi:putative PurR-regulated permease PerM [Sphingomonas sp. BK036]|uniref:AI-2E family transporter n=1 Tax=Sphingomonas sp. BK036 TaxID=2512122 RepID=UPI001029EF9A|nr:AI-2E family transporter [Sphingomonas sp. BK036]RZT56714.1 putative PurR-regulated permease PerM [Sphingomonas sp. BK036]
MTYRGRIETGGFLVFLTIITIAFGAVVSSFAAALLWSALAAILFQPLYQRLLARHPGKRNLAASLAMLIIFIAVVVPTLVIASMMIDQATSVYSSMQGGQINFSAYFKQIHDALPDRLQMLVDKSGIDSFERLQTRVSDALGNSVRTIAGQALSIGRNAFAFLLAFGIALYVTFFLLRDGDRIGPALCRSLPLEPSVTQRLVDKFVAVVRATIKGSVIVGLVQGGLGAITFWLVGVPAALLWGLLMALTSLLPALGPAIVWVPVAVYLLATGAIWQGIAVVVSGVVVIGLADNILRPILVGRDTGIPDFVVLVTTLGGIELCGLSGIVVGPVVAALFLAGWQILTEQRLGQTESDAET